MSLSIKYGSAQAGGASATQRFARFVLRGAMSAHDPKTLSQWAQHAGVSYTSLRELCYLISIPPRNARDFVRALRVVLCARSGLELIALLDVSDKRSLARFCARTALNLDSPTALDEFFAQQKLIAIDHPAIRELGAALSITPTRHLEYHTSDNTLPPSTPVKDA
jgi:hypothetical protein